VQPLAQVGRHRVELLRTVQRDPANVRNGLVNDSKELTDASYAVEVSRARFDESSKTESPTPARTRSGVGFRRYGRSPRTELEWTDLPDEEATRGVEEMCGREGGSGGRL
jgi:hypothetical protein